jgi:hypothetical protein
MLPSILIVALLLIVAYRFAIKGKIGNFSSGVGNALFQAHTFVRPSVQNIVEAKKEHREEADQGDDGPPELPPWAQSGE